MPKDLFGFLVRNHYTRDTLFSSIFRMQRICKGQNTLPSPLLYVMGLNCKVTLGLFSGFSWEQDVYGKLGCHLCVCEMRPEEKTFEEATGITCLGQLLCWHGSWGRAHHLAAVASVLPSAQPVWVLGECFPVRFITKGWRIMFSLWLSSSLSPLLQTASLRARPAGGDSGHFLCSGSENWWPAAGPPRTAGQAGRLSNSG